MATLTVKNLTTASGQDLALRTGGTDRLTISSSDGSVTIGGGLALGPSPASSGYLRIPNNQSITARNAANTGNVNLIGLNSSDQIVFGTGLSLGDQSITNVYSISQTTSSNWNISNAGVATFAGNLNLTGAGAQLYVGNTNTSTQSCLIQIGNGRTGSGQSYIDLVADTTYSDFGLRLARDGGANGSGYIQHRGTGDLALLGQDACAISLRTNNTERFRITSDGKVGISTGQPAVALQVNGDNDTTDGRIRSGTNTRFIELIRNASVDNWIRSGGNTDFIIDQNAVGNLIFRTSATERMRIGSDGAVVITNPGAAVLYVGSANTSTQECAVQIGNGRTSNGSSFMDLVGDTTYWDYGLRVLRNGTSNGSSQIIHRGTGNFDIFGMEACNMIFYTNSAERMRITSGGNIGINTSSPNNFLTIATSTADLGITLNGIGSGNRPRIIFQTGGVNKTAIFCDNGGFTSGSADSLICQTGSGGVYLANGGTSWTAVSDVRFKKNIQPLHYGLSEIKNIETIRFDYLEDDSETSARIGFSAQSVFPNIPEAVAGTLDTKLGVSAVELVPVLVRAIQQLAEKVESLEAQVASLSVT